MAEPIDFQFQLIDKMSAPAKGIADALEGMATQMKRAEDRADALTKKNEESKSGLNRFRHAFHEWSTGIESAINIGEKFIHSIVHLGKEVVDAAAKEERFVRSLEALTGSKENAEDLATAIDKLRPAFTGSEDQLKKLTQQFLALGFSVEDVGKLLPAVGDISARLGDPAKGQEFADLLTKIAARGEVGKKQLIELGTLGFQGVVKAGEKAGPAIDRILDALEKMQGGALGTGSAQGAKGLANSMQRLSEVSENFFEGLAGTEGFNIFSDGLANVLDTVGPGTAIFEKFQRTVSDVIAKVVKALFGDLTGDEGKRRIEDFFNKLIVFLEKIPGAVDGVITAFKFFADILEGAFNILTAIGEELGVELAEWFVFGEKIATFFSDLHTRAVEWGASIIDGFVKGLTDKWDSAVEAVSRGIERVVDAGKGALGIESPSKVFAEMGKQSTAGFIEGLAEDKVATAVGGMMGSAATSTAAPSSISSPRTANLTVNVNVDGSQSPTQTANAVKSTLEEMLPGMLASVFDHLAIEQGVA